MLMGVKTTCKKILLLAVTFVLAAALGACQAGPTEKGAANDGPYYTFTDVAGTNIVLQSKPQKVAVLFSSFADVWKTAGGTVSITVGESVERGIAGADALLVDAGAGKTIDTEQLIAAQPDFVIASADLAAQAEVAKLLNGNGIPCAVFHVESFDDYLAMLKVCTDITGDKQAYTTYGTEVQARIAAVKEAAAGKMAQAGRKDILFVRAGSSYSATKAKTAQDNFVCAMLQELGTYNIAEKAPVLLDGLSFEEVLSSNPDYIFIATMGKEAAARTYMDSVLEGADWQHLDAVKNGQYAYLPKDLFQYKPNAKWDEAYSVLANLLYPDGN